MAEVKRIDILLNRTREDYATKNELREDMTRVMEALHRVEDKLDRALQRDQGMAINIEQEMEQHA